MDRVFGGFFRRFNRCSRARGDELRARRARRARAQERGDGRVRRLLGADLGPVPGRAEGLHPGAGQAVPGRASCSCRTPRRWIAPKRSCAASARSRTSVPGVRDAVQFPGLSIAGFTNSPNAAHRVLRPRRLRGAQVHGAVRPEHREAAQHEAERDPGRADRRVPAAAGAGPRHDRRLQAADRGPRRPRLRRAVQGDAGRARQGAPDAGARPACSRTTR